jgi:hypothetical protein
MGKGGFLGLLGLGEKAGPYYDEIEPNPSDKYKKQEIETLKKITKKKKKPSASGDELTMEEFAERERQKK